MDKVFSAALHTFIGLMILGPNAFAANDTSFTFAGYNKLLLSNETDFNRLRLKLTARPSPYFEAHAEQDIAIENENKNGVRRDAHFATRLFRGYLQFSADKIDLTIGRQRIPLGTGRLWSALDMLNPVNPLQVERDEYVGVDAGLFEYKAGALSKLTAIYAPDPAKRNDRWLGQYRANIQGTDLTFSYGKYWTDKFAGMDFATQIGDAGLRAEWVYTRPAQQHGAPYHKILLGLDYAFANTLTLSGEMYYSSQSQQARLGQFADNPLLMQVQPFSGRYAGLSASYELTPLWKTSAYFLFNLSDHSRFIAPTLSYSATENVNLAGGIQFFSGEQSSEYGRGKKLAYVQMQWFF